MKLGLIFRGGRKLGIAGIIRTLWFNFRYFPIKTAIKIPVIVFQKIETFSLRKGNIVIENPGFNRLSLGGHGNTEWTYSRPCYLHIAGKMIVKGSGFHYFRPGICINISKGAVLELGNNFSSANDLRLTVNKKIVVGDNNMWSYDNIVLDSDVHIITDKYGKQINRPGEIIFGDNVWMGCRCTVLKNVCIANGSIIGSNTIITKSLTEPNSIYAGSEAKVIKNDMFWKRDFLN